MKPQHWDLLKWCLLNLELIEIVGMLLVFLVLVLDTESNSNPSISLPGVCTKKGHESLQSLLRVNMIILHAPSSRMQTKW